MALGARIKIARTAKGLTQQQLGDAVGMTQSAIYQLEKRDSEECLKTNAIAKVLGVTPEWLISGTGEAACFESNVEPAYALRGQVPLISWVQAGDWCEAHDPYPVGDAEMWLPAADNYGENAYALRVRGASMEPRFREGEIIVVNPHASPDNGKFVIARKEGSKEVTFKQLIREGDEAYLKAINPQWPEPIIRMDEAWHICGVVVCKMEIF